MLRFDPFRDLDAWTRQVSRTSTPAVMALDAVRTDDEVTLYFDVPGISPEDLDVSVEKNELTVRAERRWEQDGKRIIATERPQGSFSRQLMLNDALDTDRLEAELRDGVLIVTIPVDEKSKQRRVEVRADSSPTHEVGTGKGSSGKGGDGNGDSGDSGDSGE